MGFVTLAQVRFVTLARVDFDVHALALACPSLCISLFPLFLLSFFDFESALYIFQSSTSLHSPSTCTTITAAIATLVYAFHIHIHIHAPFPSIPSQQSLSLSLAKLEPFVRCTMYHREAYTSILMIHPARLSSSDCIWSLEPGL